MAMPSLNGMEKMQYSNAVGGSGVIDGGGDMHHSQWFHYQFTDWICGEFAAANAIIDYLCQHLRIVGEPGEYEVVIDSVQRRRCNWSSVLHMQQYFSVAEVMNSLQQVAWSRQQRHLNPVKAGTKEFKKSGYGFKHVEVAHKSGGESHNHSGNSLGTTAPDKREDGKLIGTTGNPDCKIALVAEDKEGKIAQEKSEGLSNKCQDVNRVGSNGKPDHKSAPVAEENEGADLGTKSVSDSSLSGWETTEQTRSSNGEPKGRVVDVGAPPNPIEDKSHSMQSGNEKQILTPTPKTFVSNETFDGKMVNVVDGLKLYDGLFDDTSVSELVSLVNELRDAGKRGQFQSPVYVASKRPMRGHGREMIQLGLPLSEVPQEDANASAISKDRKTEPFPALLQDVIEKLATMHVMTVKPESCIIDIYNEGDYSQPHTWPFWFGRPVCILFLTECDMTFGRTIVLENHGDYRGSIKLSLEPGSLLTMQGKSTDFAKHAIPSIRKQRILLTFTKSQPKKSMPSDGQRSSSALFSSSHWGPPPSRVPKHYAAVPTIGVLPATLPNSVPSMFVAAPVAPVMPFRPPVSIQPGATIWPAGSVMHPPPRFPVPGTGVFLPPPGSGNSSSTQQFTTGAEINFPAEMPSLPEKDNQAGKSNQNVSIHTKENEQVQECNGTMDELKKTAENEMETKPVGED